MSLSTPNDDDSLSSPKKGKSLSTEKIKSIKESVSIVSVVESYGLSKFRRKGPTSATAVCPFHDDTNPSLSIDDNRRMFKCFSCGAGGDVFKFVRDYSDLQGESMSFFQSVQRVVKEHCDPSVAIDIDSYYSGPSMSQEERKALEAKKSRMLFCNAVAADYFAKSLVSVAHAAPARAYLRQRGLLPRTVQRFALGFAPDTFFQRRVPRGEGSLVSHLKAAGFTREEIIESGLAKPMKKPTIAVGETDTDGVKDGFDDLLDTFRGRIIVPIFDDSGTNVIAFGGRVLPSLEKNEQTNYKAPKYLNSPESVVFHKKNELFGLHTAKEALEAENDSKGRKVLLIVEGYMDAIALWNNDVPVVAASMGTSLTFEQLSRAAKAVTPHSGTVQYCKVESPMCDLDVSWPLPFLCPF